MHTPLSVNRTKHSDFVDILDAYGSEVARLSSSLAQAADDAAFIVLACNAHDDLVAACKAADELLSRGMSLPDYDRRRMSVVFKLRAAISAAER